jgi:cyclophilin family peptidyl-prolyl cis-trans isomerase
VEETEKNPRPEIEETLILRTSVGDIRIGLRPDLSRESVEHIRNIVENNNCEKCEMYFASKKEEMVQGIMGPKTGMGLPPKGNCPEGFEAVENVCPEWNPNCGCHGPVMTHGMVAWAGGQAGPHFFIHDKKEPATGWGTIHTVWGEIRDDESFKVVEHILELPKKNKKGFLDKPLPYTMEIERTQQA